MAYIEERIDRLERTVGKILKVFKDHRSWDDPDLKNFEDVLIDMDNILRDLKEEMHREAKEKNPKYQKWDWVTGEYDIDH